MYTVAYCLFSPKTSWSQAFLTLSYRSPSREKGRMTTALTDVASSINESPVKTSPPRKHWKKAVSTHRLTPKYSFDDNSSRRCQLCQQTTSDENVFGKLLEYFPTESKTETMENQVEKDNSTTSDPSIHPPPTTPSASSRVVRVHVNCALFASGLSQSLPEDDPFSLHGFAPKDVVAEFRRSRRLACAFCKGMDQEMRF